MAKNEKQAKNKVGVANNRKVKQTQKLLTPMDVNHVKIIIKAFEKVSSEWMDVYLSQFLS